MFQTHFVKIQKAHSILCLIFSKQLPIRNNVKVTAEGDKRQMEI